MLKIKRDIFIYVAYISETFFPMLEKPFVVNNCDVAMCFSLSVGHLISTRTRTPWLSVKTNKRNPEKGTGVHGLQPFSLW